MNTQSISIIIVFVTGNTILLGLLEVPVPNFVLKHLLSQNLNMSFFL